jgi:hypothetical protein
MSTDIKSLHDTHISLVNKLNALDKRKKELYYEQKKVYSKRKKLQNKLEDINNKIKKYQKEDTQHFSNFPIENIDFYKEEDSTKTKYIINMSSDYKFTSIDLIKSFKTLLEKCYPNIICFRCQNNEFIGNQCHNIANTIEQRENIFMFICNLHKSSE